MISVVRLWETLSQRAKTGTSGYQTADEFNRDLSSVQTDLISLIGPAYAESQGVQDIISPFVIAIPLSETLPNDYFQFVSAEVNGNPSYPIAPNQVAIYKTSPIRKPTVENGLSFHYFVNDKVYFITAENPPTGTMIYIKHPNPASIELQITSTDFSDYVTPVAVSDLEWPERAFNIILYMMMQRLGMEMKDDLMLEMSNIGLNIESQKL